MNAWQWVAFAVVLALTGCHGQRHTQAKEVGSDLPVTSSGSAALPDAIDAADAPHAPSVAEPRTSDLTLYRDPEAGVNFTYPTAWRPANAAEDLPPPEFQSIAGAPRMTQVFVPKGTMFEGTNLQSLGFSYTGKRNLTTASCAAIPARALAHPVKKSTATYGGVSYAEATGGDAGACHRMATTVDSTLHNGECVIFERDVATLCPDRDGAGIRRALTAEQLATLERHLDAVMESVQIVSR